MREREREREGGRAVVTREPPNAGRQHEPPVLDVAARAVLGQVWTAMGEPPVLNVAHSPQLTIVARTGVRVQHAPQLTMVARTGVRVQHVPQLTMVARTGVRPAPELHHLRALTPTRASRTLCRTFPRFRRRLRQMPESP
ncbi:hypothetical protein B566_EDAN016643 [Ephemera danica]|nr:hypothetical protein B566_EDAN016643 [Ephemera danica]